MCLNRSRLQSSWTIPIRPGTVDLEIQMAACRLPVVRTIHEPNPYQLTPAMARTKVFLTRMTLRIRMKKPRNPPSSRI